MPERLTDARLANEIANLPEVGPYLMADCDFDFTEAVENDRNFFLHDDGGIAVFAWSAPRVYECHLFFRPETRGKRAVEASMRMIDWMHPRFASAFWAQPPIGQKAAIWIGLRVGFKMRDTFNHPQLGPVQYLTWGLS